MTMIMFDLHYEIKIMRNDIRVEMQLYAIFCFFLKN